MRYDRLTALDADTANVQDQRIAVVGAGATGSHMLANLARLGANLTIIDRDFLEPSNLATSALYTEAQVDDRLPKAQAAQDAITQVNSDLIVDAHVTDLHRRNVHTLLDDADLVLDGTDNLATRHLLNEYCQEQYTPWVHVAVLGHTGEVLPVHKATACFNCLFNDVDATSLGSCETAGIRPATAATAAGIATTTATDMLTGGQPTGLTRFNLRQRSMDTYDVTPRDDCPVCQDGIYPHLSGDTEARVVTLCGENKYQVRPGNDVQIDLDRKAAELANTGTVTQNDQLLRFESTDTSFTVFADGRAIIDAGSPDEAKSVYARFVGS